MLPVKAGLPGKALRLVPYLSPEEVGRLCQGCRGRHRERDALLILVLFQTGLRISEALGLTVGHLNRHPGFWRLWAKEAVTMMQRRCLPVLSGKWYPGIPASPTTSR